MSRKEKLQYRASWYGDRNQDVPQHLAGSRGYEAGYRAAMKDLRKIVRECEAENKWHPVHEAVRRLASISHCVRVRTKRFLRPLR